MTIHPAVFAVSLLATAFSLLVYFLKRARYRRWSRSSGVVVALIRCENNDHDGPGVTFSPRVSFRTSAGEMVEFVSSVSSFPSPAAGDTVAVLYDPDDPHEATIDGFMFCHLAEFVVFCLGFVVVAVYVFQHFGG